METLYGTHHGRSKKDCHFTEMLFENGSATLDKTGEVVDQLWPESVIIPTGVSFSRQSTISLAAIMVLLVSAISGRGASREWNRKSSGKCFAEEKRVIKWGSFNNCLGVETDIVEENTR